MNVEGMRLVTRRLRMRSERSPPSPLAGERTGLMRFEKVERQAPGVRLSAAAGNSVPRQGLA